MKPDPLALMNLFLHGVEPYIYLGYKLDITWLKDELLEDSDQLPEPQDLAGEAITELEAVVDDLREIVRLIEKEEGVET